MGESPQDFVNPYKWFFARTEDAEWWTLAGDTRDEAIASGKADNPGESFWISEARRLTPSFDLFEAADLVERLSEDECWGEDGWEGAPCGVDQERELEAELTAVLRVWAIRHGSLDGAQLDSRHVEQVPA